MKNNEKERRRNAEFLSVQRLKIYNPAKFQNKKPNIFGDNDPFVPTNSTLKIFEIRG